MVINFADKKFVYEYHRMIESFDKYGRTLTPYYENKEKMATLFDVASWKDVLLLVKTANDVKVLLEKQGIYNQDLIVWVWKEIQNDTNSKSLAI